MGFATIDSLHRFLEQLLPGDKFHRVRSRLEPCYQAISATNLNLLRWEEEVDTKLLRRVLKNLANVEPTSFVFISCTTPIPAYPWMTALAFDAWKDERKLQSQIRSSLFPTIFVDCLAEDYRFLDLVK